MQIRAAVVVEMCIVLIGLVGNILTMLVYLLSSKLRTPSNLFILLLNVTCISWLLLQASIIATEMVGYRFYSDSVCQFLGSMALVIPQMFMDSIVAISVVRYISVVHSQRTQRLLTWWRCLVAGERKRAALLPVSVLAPAFSQEKRTAKR